VHRGGGALPQQTFERPFEQQGQASPWKARSIFGRLPSFDRPPFDRPTAYLEERVEVTLALVLAQVVDAAVLQKKKKEKKEKKKKR
jgi:hypothetical protein